MKLSVFRSMSAGPGGQLLLSTLAAFVPLSTFAAAPAWWTERAVIDTSQTRNDFAAVNVGQLKHIAQQALAEMDEHLMGGAGPYVHAMVDSFSAITPERNDYAAVNIGQVKAVVQPFYDRLVELRYATSYPWSDGGDDYALANTGQVKSLFSFDIAADTDLDLLPDMWETINGLDPDDYLTDPMTSLPVAKPNDVVSDADLDGMTAWQEYLAGTDSNGGSLQATNLKSWLRMEWTSLRQAQTSVSDFGGTRLWKSGGTSSADADALSSLSILSEGAFRWVVSTPAKTGAVGLSSSNLSATASDLIWAFVFTGGGTCQIWHQGSAVVSDIPCHTTDVFEIELLNRIVRMKRNGLVLHEAASAAPASLKADTSFTSSGFQIDRIEAWGLKTDTDADGMDDVWEETILYTQMGSHFPNIAAILPGADLDGDGVTNFQEYLDGTLPYRNDADSDQDGLPAYFESQVAGLSDADATDAHEDLDGDGLSNLYEYQKNGEYATYSINRSADAVDADEDGLSDVFEKEFGFDPSNFYDSVIDPDDDGVLNFEEAAHALNPHESHSRNATLADWTVIGGLDGSAAASSNPPQTLTDWDADSLPNWWEHLQDTQIRVADDTADPDNDGSPNSEEYARKTLPDQADTDNDGINDTLDPTPGSVEFPLGEPIENWKPNYYEGEVGLHYASRGIRAEQFASYNGGSMIMEHAGDDILFAEVLTAMGTAAPWPYTSVSMGSSVVSADSLSRFLTLCNDRLDKVREPWAYRFWEPLDDLPLGERLGVTGLSVVDRFTMPEVPFCNLHTVHYGRVDNRFYYLNEKMAEPDRRLFFHVRDIRYPVTECYPSNELDMAARTVQQRIVTHQVGLNRTASVPLAQVFSPSGAAGAFDQIVNQVHNCITTPVIFDLDINVSGGTHPDKLEDEPGFIVPPTIPLLNSVRIHDSGIDGTFELKCNHPAIGFLTDVSNLDANTSHNIQPFRLSGLPLATPVKISLHYSVGGVDYGEVDSVTFFPVGIDIEQVFSDQIAGNEANKLPTPYYRVQPNNPMVMATRAGRDAYLAVKMNVPAGLASKIRVGCREAGTSTILGSAPSLVSPAKTLLQFTALNGSKTYEVVAGYDADGNSSLDPFEVAVVFQKTPKLNEDGTPYTPLPGTVGDPSFTYLDKIKIITLDDFTAARTTTDNYGGGTLINTTYPTAAKMIQAFARGDTTIAGASPAVTGLLLDASTIPSADGLSHPLGGKWNAANQTTTHRLVLPTGSDLAEDVVGSDGLRLMYARVLYNKRAVLAAAATSSWATATIPVTDNEFDFSVSDSWDQVHVALGKCRFEGYIEAEIKSNASGSFDVRKLNCYGSMIDLYDFAYGGTPVSFNSIFGSLILADPKVATRTQAGNATLASGTYPEAGRVFFTKVEFGTGWFTYTGSYTP